MLVGQRIPRKNPIVGEQFASLERRMFDPPRRHNTSRTSAEPTDGVTLASQPGVSGSKNQSLGLD